MIRACLAASSVAALLSPPAIAEVPSIELAAQAFGARPSASHADLSPDGAKLIYIASGSGKESAALIMDVATLRSQALVKSAGAPEELYRCDFVTNRWVTCKFGGIVSYFGQLVTMTRTILVDTQTGQVKSLTVGDKGQSSSLNQFDGAVIDYLPDEEGAFLMQRNYPGEQNALGVDRVDVDPLKFRSLERPSGRADYYMTDGHGTVRFAVENVTTLTGSLTGETRYRYRVAGSRDWRELDGMGEDFAPLTVDRATDSLFYLDKLDGRLALYRMALDGTRKTTLVGKHPSVDIDNVIRFYPGGPIVGYRYTDDRSRAVYTDPEAAKLGASLQRALPAAPLIDIVGATKDRQKLLVFASGDTDPGAYYVLNRTTRELKSVAEAREALVGVALAKVKPSAVPTRDGKTIPVYITAAPDRPAANQPVVILPHGGPSARDEWGFDWLAQFLAVRGYTVIQPNYRGSSGYGDAFLGENAFKGWKQAMSDIADTTDWAVKSGLADPQRLAIVGWSYGGYAALQSASMDPRYKAVVAVAPVTDLGALRRDAEGFTDADLAKAEIGKGPHLKEGSPLNHASEIKAPVLLAHGTVDVNVYFAHSRRMDAALRKAGTPVEFLQYKDLDHYLDDGRARVQLLTRIGLLLDKTIGH